MGLEFKIENIEAKILDKVTCDRCSRELKKISDGGWNQAGEPYSMFHPPYFEEYFLLKKEWGYGSQRDGDSQEAVICESCYYTIFKDVKMKVTNDWADEVLG